MEKKDTVDVGHEVKCSSLCEKMKLLALGCRHGNVAIFSIDSCDKLHDKKIHNHDITDVKLTTEFLSDKEEEALLFTGSYKKIKVHKMNAKNVKDSFQLLMTLTGHTDFVLALVVFPEQKMLLSGSFDKSMKVWDVTKH